MDRLKKNLDANKKQIGELGKNILEGVVIPEGITLDVKAELLVKEGAKARSPGYSAASPEQKLKTKVIQMVREFERLFKGVVDQEQVERVIEGFLSQLKDSRLYSDVETTIRRIEAEEELGRLRENFAAAASIYVQAIDDLKIQHPELRLSVPRNLFDILERSQVSVYKTEGQGISIVDESHKTV